MPLLSSLFPLLGIVDFEQEMKLDDLPVDSLKFILE